MVLRTSISAPKRSWMALATLLICTPLLAQSLPTAPCSFLSDSGGSTADSGTSISLTFNGRGGLFFSGSGTVQVQDTGSYSVSGNSITVSLPGVGKSANGPWSLSANTLRLPFQLFRTMQVLRYGPVFQQRVTTHREEDLAPVAAVRT
jgi:hypothetical protein